MRPGRELICGRQVAVDQEVCDLKVGRGLGELLDRIAAVLKDSGLAIEIGDRRATRRRVHERRVVRAKPGTGRRILELQKLSRADGAVCDR